MSKLGIKITVVTCCHLLALNIFWPESRRNVLSFSTDQPSVPVLPVWNVTVLDNMNSSVSAVMLCSLTTAAMGGYQDDSLGTVAKHLPVYVLHICRVVFLCYKSHLFDSKNMYFIHKPRFDFRHNTLDLSMLLA